MENVIASAIILIYTALIFFIGGILFATIRCIIEECTPYSSIASAVLAVVLMSLFMDAIPTWKELTPAFGDMKLLAAITPKKKIILLGLTLAGVLGHFLDDKKRVKKKSEELDKAIKEAKEEQDRILEQIRELNEAQQKIRTGGRLN